MKGEKETILLFRKSRWNRRYVRGPLFPSEEKEGGVSFQGTLHIPFLISFQFGYDWFCFKTYYYI